MKALHPAVPGHPLRPPRPRQVQRAARPLLVRALWPRRAGDPRRAQHRRTRTGAGCRWAAWSDNGSGANAPGPVRQDRSRQHHLPLSRSDQLHDRIKAVTGRRHRRIADTVIAGWLTADFREREPQITAKMTAMLHRYPGAGLCRLLRGAEHAGPARAAAEDQEPGADHRRPARHVDPGRGRRVHPQPDSRRQHDPARRRAHVQCRTAHAFTDAVVGFLTQR